MPWEITILQHKHITGRLLLKDFTGSALEEPNNYLLAILYTNDTENAGMWGIRGNTVAVTREQNQQTLPRFHYS